MKKHVSAVCLCSLCLKLYYFLFSVAASIYIFSLTIHFWLIGIMFSQLRVTLFQSLVLGMTDFQKITFPPMGLLSRYSFFLLFMYKNSMFKQTIIIKS